MPISNDLKNLDRIIGDEFSRALTDEIAPDVAARWKGKVVEYDVIDTGSYLESIGVGDVSEGRDGATFVVEAPGAPYAGAIKRRGGDYVGRRAAEEGIEAADADINAALDRAADRVKG